VESEKALKLPLLLGSLSPERMERRERVSAALVGRVVLGLVALLIGLSALGLLIEGVSREPLLALLASLGIAGCVAAYYRAALRELLPSGLVTLDTDDAGLPRPAVHVQAVPAGL
jgi:hypothetical protein